MNFDAAIEYLDEEIKHEGTRSDVGQVLVAARDTVAQRNAGLLSFDWVEAVSDEIYDATSNGPSGYGDSDYADDVLSNLCHLLNIEFEDE